VKSLIALWMVGITCVFAPSASAQSDFPARPIKMYVPFPPGGGIDVTARIAADQIAKELGQSIVITIRAAAAARLQPTRSYAPIPTATRCSIIRSPASCMPP